MSYLEFVRDGEVIFQVPVRDTPMLRVDGHDQIIAMADGQAAHLPGVEVRVCSGTPTTRGPAVPSPTPGGPPRLPGYEIEGKLGEGGMGAVWLATQQGTGRKVAIKTLLMEGIKEEQIARFALEIKVTAQLEHENIGRLYESHLASNLCYYAMEFIDGVELEDWIASQKPNEKQLLSVMAKVCRAVNYAHQRGIIHRDLKPGNVMITTAGEPKVVDFGIAKLADDEKSPEEVKKDSKLTQAGTYLGTPAYMSPEQIKARPELIDTRTDVYALGVMLYEFICGVHPHGEVDSTMVLFMKVVREEPARPRSVKRSISKDLEAVLLKALAKKPEERYSSAGLLADDLERYLKGEPVSAQPQTAGYLLRKKLAKHKGKVFLATIAMLAIVSYGVVSLVLIRAERDRAQDAQRIAEMEREKAEARFESGRDFAKTLIFNLDDKLDEGSTATRAELVAQTSAYLEKLQSEAGDRADVLFDVASAYVKVGEVQQAKGDTEEALASWNTAITLFDSLQGRDGVDANDLARGRAQARVLIAGVQRQEGDFKASKATFELAIDDLDDDDDNRDVLARAYQDYGRLLSQTGDTRDAGKYYKKALSIRKKDFEKDEDDNSALIDLASIRYTLGNLRLDEGKPAAAQKEFKKSLELREKLLARSPKNLSYQRRVASGLRGMGIAHQARGQLDEASAALTRSFEIYQEQANGDPDNQKLKVSLLWAYLYLAEVQIARNLEFDARAKLSKAIDLGSKLVDDNPDDDSIKRLFARLLITMGQIDLDNKRSREALQMFEQALAVTEPMVKANEKDLYAIDPHSTALLGLGEAHWARGEYTDAWSHAEKALGFKRRLVKGSPRDKSYRLSLAHGLRTVGLVALGRKINLPALQHLTEADKIYSDLLKTDKTNAAAREGLVETLVAKHEAHNRLAKTADGGEARKHQSDGCTALKRAQETVLSPATTLRVTRSLEDEQKLIDKGLAKCR